MVSLLSDTSNDGLVREAQFEVPWATMLNDDVAFETTIMANCTFLRGLAADVYALKAHAIRDVTPAAASLRHAFYVCFNGR